MSSENKQQKMISLSDYYDELDKLDWTYEMSDDHFVWRRGATAMGNAQMHARVSEEHRKLFDAFKAHKWSGWKRNPDGSPNYEAGREVPKPERPKVEGFRTGESNE